MRVILAEKNTERETDLSILLDKIGLVIDRSEDLQSTEEMLKSDVFDLIILTTTFLSIDEVKDLITRYRENMGIMPVFTLLEKGTIDNLIEMLNIGADGCLIRPFNSAELEARIRALLRSTQIQKTKDIECGPLKWNSFSNTFTLDGELLEITPKEKAVLEVFVRNPNVVLPKELIANKVYSFNDYADLKAISLYIHRLRHKITNAKIIIETLKHQGYVLKILD